MRALLPKKLNKETIVDSVVELRFTTDLPKSIIFGLIYNSVKDEFPVITQTGVLELPESVRNNDPSFAFQPHYRVSNDNFTMQIGPDIIAISSFPKYLGWETYSQKCVSILQTIKSLNIIKTVTRLGIRYINKFDGNILPNTNFDFKINTLQDTARASMVVMEVEYPNTEFKSRVQYNLINEPDSFGPNIKTLIDIDTSIADFYYEGIEGLWSRIEEGHNIEKKLFFDLLKEDFVQKLEPEYE